MPNEHERELLPCPFCGQSMALAVELEPGWWRVVCGGCGSATGKCKDREHAIRMWNRRSTNALESRIAELEAALRACLAGEIGWRDMAREAINRGGKEGGGGS